MEPGRLPLPAPLGGLPVTALAPMQDVTTLAFMRVIARCGAPDYFFTEFIRVHETAVLDEDTRRCLVENDTGRPIFAQLIGESLEPMARMASTLLKLPVAGIDLNLGCPAPKVYRKNVGGGLLRDPARVDELLACLRACVDGLFTVKMRIGFDDTEHFERFLGLVQHHRVDLLSLHARTVRDLYRAPPRHAYTRRAVEVLDCPVLANGGVDTAEQGIRLWQETGAHGVMIGRGAIRNPWIFRQIREMQAGGKVFAPTLGDVRQYIAWLVEATAMEGGASVRHANRMKKFLNFVALGVDGQGQFLHEMRRAADMAALLGVCDAHLLHGGRDAWPFAVAPYPGLVARPNCESAACGFPMPPGEHPS